MYKYRFEDIDIGHEESFSRILTEADVRTFAELSGDMNPLHMDLDYAKNTQFQRPIVHGALAASLFSTLVGMYLPGKYCLYLSQDIQFKKHMYPGDNLTVYGKIINKYDTLQMMEIETKIFNKNGEVAIFGTAKIKFLK